MKRSNRPVLVLGLMLAVVAFGAILSASAPRGTAGAARTADTMADLGPGRHAMAASIAVVLEDPTHGTPEGAAAPAVNLDDPSNATTVKVLVQNVQVRASTLPATASPDSPADAEIGQPIIDERLVNPGISPRHELIRYPQLDGNLSLLLRSPQDAASADVTTTGVMQRQLVDELGVLPPRVVPSQLS